MTKEDKWVERIIEDLTDRKGFRQCWEETDEEIQNEIRETWIDILKNPLICPKCGSPAIEQCADIMLNKEWDLCLECYYNFNISKINGV